MEGRVLVRAGGQTSADTTRALTFFEAGYGPVQYVPLAEVATSLLRPSRRTTRCSLKGECRYLTITLPGGGHLFDAAWSYDRPDQNVAAIAGHVAFYSERVDVIRL
jgi:uncharacterized protein (DUF427 family)